MARATLKVSWDLVPNAGWNSTRRAVLQLIEKTLKEQIPHYKPKVELALNSGEALTDPRLNCKCTPGAGFKHYNEVHMSFEEEREALEILKEV